MGGGVGNNSTKCKYSRITTHTNLVNRNTSFKNFCLLSERLAKDVLETRWRWLFLFRREVVSVSRCEEHVAGEVMKKLYSYSRMEMHFWRNTDYKNHWTVNFMDSVTTCHGICEMLSVNSIPSHVCFKQNFQSQYHFSQ